MSVRATVQIKGHQYTCAQGDRLVVDRLEASPGDTVVFDEVKLLSQPSEVQVGDPLVEGARVEVQVEEQRREPKVIVFKKKRRKDYKRKRGHKQPVTAVKVTAIEYGYGQGPGVVDADG